jgi:hypothetical protein
MKSPAKSAAWLLPFLLTGCFHTALSQDSRRPQPMLAPLIEPSQAIQLVDIELPPTMRSIPGKPLYNMREDDEPVRPPCRHWRRANPTEIVSGRTEPRRLNPGPEVSAIGELSSGDPGE